MYDTLAREQKARTMVAVLENHLQSSLKTLNLLNVGGSTGIIDNYLSDHFGAVASIDIDSAAIHYAQTHFQKDNLQFQVGDALNLEFPDNSFDVVICSQVYEHVPLPQKMMDEIFRVLKPSGVCYFAAGNRLMWNEPHYNLPLLSVLPRPLSHLYVKLTGKAEYYHELHYTYWGLKSLTKRFIVKDVTLEMVLEPSKYHIDYMLPAGTAKAFVSKMFVRYLRWLCPGYIWLLYKPI
jgi:ubiquinone/menaquinone biosynthesis C-methylase UbiE